MCHRSTVIYRCGLHTGWGFFSVRTPRSPPSLAKESCVTTDLRHAPTNDTPYVTTAIFVTASLVACEPAVCVKMAQTATGVVSSRALSTRRPTTYIHGQAGHSSETDDAPAVHEAFSECGCEGTVVFEPTTYRQHDLFSPPSGDSAYFKDTFGCAMSRVESSECGVG